MATKIDLVDLRAKANAAQAQIDKGVKTFNPRVMEFVEAASPETVLALIDRIEDLEKTLRGFQLLQTELEKAEG